MRKDDYLGLHMASSDMPKGSGGSYRLQLYQRAANGDKGAKREMEAAQLLRAANDATSKLRDRAAAGDQQAVASLQLIASGKAQHFAGTAVPGAPVFTGVDVARADAVALKRERARWEAVYASEHSRGRERGCAALLSNSRSWTSAQIIAELPHLPTDRENAANDPAAKARADADWAKAHEIVTAQNKASGRDQQDQRTAAETRRHHSQARLGGQVQ